MDIWVVLAIVIALAVLVAIVVTIVQRQRRAGGIVASGSSDKADS